VYGRYALDHPNLTGQALRDAFAADPTIKAQFPDLQTQGSDLLRANATDPWQDVVFDVGGANGLQFFNAFGGPSAAGGGAGAGAGGAAGAGGGAFGENDQGAGTGGAIINELMARLLGGQGLFGNLSGTVNTTGGGGGGGGNDALRSSILAALQDLIKQGQQPVGDVGNTEVARQFALSQQRSGEQQRRAVASRRAAEGTLNSGGFDTEVGKIQQQQAVNQATYEAGLVDNILNDRRAKLVTALQTGAGIMNADQQAELQRELQHVNSVMAENSLKLQLAQALLSNQRFYDELGFNIGQTELSGNQAALPA